VAKALISEFIGTALLIAAGLSVVIIIFGAGSPALSVLPNPGIRRLTAGFLFGTIGALIAVSWVGKTSGAHINPAVTAGFWIMRKMNGALASGYILAQCSGAILGAAALLIWGNMGKSIDYGATLPNPNSGVWPALGGEIITTLALFVGIIIFIGHKRLSRWTPLLFPFLYAIMVYLEAPISGTSTNPARTLGPAVVSRAWHGWWIYFIGPAIGALLGASFQRFKLFKEIEIEVAKIYHFGHDPHGIFHSGNSDLKTGRESKSDTLELRQGIG